MRPVTRKSVMESMSVHNLTKDVLKLSENKDVVDSYFDILLALKVIKAEMDSALKDSGYITVKLLSSIAILTLAISFVISGLL